ncbi:DUF2130 domain-containing protein [Prochlorococcus marinus]|uniref:DUF2130 domain-containing protein n=1 Tax=Prochlorococcus marinus str. PAC1 TaxID=59924 RepID=A0A0A2C2Z7_PROMR|nr:DUF2130 domain-containing protein [Prochlorococcus marinus]KGG19280.1 hypothetical protein EV03_1660 [Prochlorococcus marinus str. PAC1]
MKSSNEIKCPQCKSIFKIDDTNYAAIQNQVRDHLFEEQLKTGIATAVSIAEQKLINNHNKYMHQKNTNIKELENKITNLDKDKKIAISESLKPIMKEKNEYKEKLAVFEKDKKLAISEAIKTLEEQNNSLKIKLSKTKSDAKLLQIKEKTKYNQEIKDRDKEIERLIENKSKLSVKMVGESLEESCLIEYEKYIRRAFPSASFEKDNKTIKGSKGDYIFRDFDDNQNEIVSIMFEMKNELEGSKNKRKNNEFYKKLNRDRINKNCEYACLISKLEPENDLFNSGITTVYHEYPKMIVIRPNCFISLIYTLREMGRQILEYKLLIEDEKSKNVDVSNFKESLNILHNSSGKYLKNIFNDISKIITCQNNIIENADKSIDIALKTDRNIDSLKREIKDITIDNLTKDNATMIKLFEEQSDLEAA